MEETTHFEHEINPEDLEPRPFTIPERRRILWVVGILVLLVLMALLPPLINMNRFRRQITNSISISLGRPVRLDSVTLDLLPMPGFTLQNFVVTEDPSFGSEPVIHANTVKARLRWRSMWRGRVEFSRISLQDPSVNLVHRPGANGERGSWNIESILLQASRMPAAPTDQRTSGPAPRFPYIEATGARVNLKMGLEKMPLSLTEADFALWLPQPGQWHLRLESHPTRTDTAATDTGTFRLEGTLQHAASLDDVPIDLQASWSRAPMGNASWVLLGRDAGFRGNMNLTAAVKGTVGRHALDTQLTITDLRRADFVPVRTLEVNLRCRAQVLNAFQQLRDIHCAWPPTAGDSALLLTGEVPDLQQPHSASIHAAVKQLDAALLLDMLRVASSRVAPDLTLAGSLAADAACCQLSPSASNPGIGTFTIAGAKLALPGGAPFISSTITGTVANQQFSIDPLPLDLGAPVPATLDAHGDAHGYSLHLTGAALPQRLSQLADALPQFGDGLALALAPPSQPAPIPSSPLKSTASSLAAAAPVAPPAPPAAPIHIDLVSTRAWGTGQTWSSVVSPRPLTRRKRREKTT